MPDYRAGAPLKRILDFLASIRELSIDLVLG
jgi:hypothetical protein